MTNHRKIIDIYFRHLATLCVFFVMPFMSSTTVAETLVSDHNPLLYDILKLNSANLQQLQTWQGRVEVTIKDEWSDGSIARTADVQFAWDNLSENWFYRWEFISAETDIANGGINAGMLVNGLWHAVTLGLPAGNVTNGVTITPAKPPKIDITQEAFDPHNFFFLRGKPLGNRIDLWVKADELTWLELTVSRDGGLITIEESNKTIEDARSTYIFDMSKSGVLVSYKTFGFGRQENIDVEWNEQSSVWVPTRFLYRNYTDSENIYREFAWKESFVNKIITDDTFTIETLRLSHNTIVSDARDGSRVVINAHKNTRHPPSPSKQLQKRVSYNQIFTLVAFNLFVLISIVAILLFYRFRTNV